MNIKKFLVAVSLFSSLVSLSAPFRGYLDITNSKGKNVQIYGEGDEFDAFFESKEGYSLVWKDGPDSYFYAIKDGESLIASDIEIGEETETIPSSLEKHLRDTSSKHEKEVQDRIAEDEETNHTNENWEELKGDDGRVKVEIEEKGWFSVLVERILSWFGKAPTRQIALKLPPKEHTVGNVVGLTIMVDFPIKGSSYTEAQRSHPNVTRNTVDESLNSLCESKYNPSVRRFYMDASCGKLNVTNMVFGYVLLDKPRSYYDDITKNCGTCGRLLVKDTFAKLQKLPNYKTEIYPRLQTLSYNGKKQIRSLSVMFAGGSAKKWSYGLWAHKSAVSGLPTIVSTDGTKMKFSTYQISSLSDIGSGSIYAGTFIHESGHMVCAFPDLYDYDHKSKGAGYYSYMAIGYSVDPYLAYKAGWIEPIEIMQERQELVLPADCKTVYKYTNPSNTKEYFLVKYCNQEGLEKDMPGKGVVIMRCNESGSNTHSSFIGRGKDNNKYRRSYEFSVVQADGNYDLERNVNQGGQDDFWTDESQYADDVTVPNLSWRNNKPSMLKISNFIIGETEARCMFEVNLPKIVVESKGFEGKYDKRPHKITVTKIDPKSGVKIKYSKTKDGPYSSTNPSYRNVGSYVTYFMASKDGYMTTNGFERIIIGK